MLTRLGLDFYFADPLWVHLAWPIAALVGVLAWLELRGNGALGAFVSPRMQRRLVRRPSLERRIARLACVGLALVAGMLALMRPQTRGDAQTIAAGRLSADIMVVLDVSRSMLADDAAPTRLTRAKAEIAELSSRLTGHRIGLVAFAGRAQVMCPLTPDYGFFRMVLAGVDTSSVSHGGTMIGAAIRKAVASFDAGPGAKLILLITDGEDHDSYPREAAKEAVAAGVRIVTIGIGSEDGTQISVVDPKTRARSLITDSAGQPVISRLDGALLRDIALTTEGAYVPAGVAALDLESIANRHIEPIVRDADSEAAAAAARATPNEHYRWFALAALALLCAAVVLGAFGASGSRREAW